MKMSRIAALGALMCLFPHDWAGAGAPDSSEPVAIIYSFTGEAMLTFPAEERRPLRLFDRLPAGTTVEVGPGSRLELAFSNGRRYELGESSTVVLESADLSLRSGPVHPLSAVPPLPHFAQIAEDDQPGLSAGAVRTRLGLKRVGQAGFLEEVRLLTALRKAVKAAGDGASWALLAEIDRSLGYLVDARREFRAAVRRSPGDVRLAAALSEVEQSLSQLEDHHLIGQ